MNKSQSMGMYIILGIMVLAFISMLFAGPSTTTEELTYTNFLQKLSAGDIKSVEMDKDFLIATPKVQPKKQVKKDLPMLMACNNHLQLFNTRCLHLMILL